MNAYALLEALILGAALLASAWTVLGSLAPQLRARLLRRLGRPPAAPVAKAGCDSGCSSCGTGCGTPKTAREQPIRFHPSR